MCYTLACSFLSRSVDLIYLPLHIYFCFLSFSTFFLTHTYIRNHLCSGGKSFVSNFYFLFNRLDISLSLFLSHFAISIVTGRLVTFDLPLIRYTCGLAGQTVNLTCARKKRITSNFQHRLDV
ncbi:hypothetical protein F4775DRAFT_513021 [Biscogniauxia sp. FL1348]|nr:hypothetical protein F4775DRAFT_513021 [Biscogniauxia sp. FL1348]